MKKLNLLFVLIGLSITIISCETYDDYDTNRRTVAGFTVATKSISSVPEGGTKDTSLDLFVSDVSSVARTFNVVVVNIPSDTTASPPENYTFNPTLTIPGNTRRATMTFTAVDVSLNNVSQTVTLAIEGQEDVVSGGRVKISMKN